MKHVFYIHSYITYIVAVSVVAELAIDHNDVVFIYGRGFFYRDQPDIKTVDLSKDLMELSRIPSYGQKFIVFSKHHQIAQLDSLIRTLTNGQKFTAYLPLSKNYLMQLIATHPKCHDVVFLEEGLLSYTGKFSKKPYSRFVDGWRGKFAAFLRYPNHGYRSFFYRPYRHTLPMPIYMLHEAPDIADPDIDIRVLRSIVVPPLDPRFKIDHGYVLIVDTVVEDGITSQGNYLSVLEGCILDLLKNQVNIIWIRFRPAHPVSANIVALFEKHSIQVKILPEEICVESVFYYAQNLTVIGLHSSLLFYAAIWGHKSYSLLRKLFAVDAEAERKYKTALYIPAVFHRLVVDL